MANVGRDEGESRLSDWVSDLGATTVEYGVLVGLIIAVVIGAVLSIGQSLLAALTSFSSNFSALVPW